LPTIFYGKVVFPRQFHKLYTGQCEFIHGVRKLTVLIMPKNDAAFMKFRQWGGKPLREP
jgi:hypothetical protein